jgi:hypothetical protein
MHPRRGDLINQARITSMPLNTNATGEFLRYYGLRKEHINPFDQNFKLMKVGYLKIKYFDTKNVMKIWRRESWKGIYQEGGRGGD